MTSKARASPRRTSCITSSSASERRSSPIGLLLRISRRCGSLVVPLARDVVEHAQRLAADVAQRPLREVERAVRRRAALVAARAGAQEHEPGGGARADDDGGGRAQRGARPVSRGLYCP